MPISYSIKPELSLVVTHFTGRPTDDEFLRVYETILSDADYGLGTDELADLREVEALDISTAALRAVETLFRERYEGSGAGMRTAIVAPRDQPYGLARMYQTYMEDGPEVVRVFRDTGAALEWLDLSRDALNEEP